MPIEINICGALGAEMASQNPIEKLEHLKKWFFSNTELLAPKETEYPHLANSFYLSLHPGASDLQLTLEGNLVRVLARTGAPGPGYHAFITMLLLRLERDGYLYWTNRDTADGTGYLTSKNYSDLQEHYSQWIVSLLNAQTLQDSPAMLCMAIDHQYPDQAAPILTQLGPRSESWFELAKKDHSVAVDILPWWNVEMDAQYFLHRALCLMWNIVCWRKPIVNEEVDTLQGVHSLLTEAYKRDKSLAYPWKEWKEVIDLLAKPANLGDIITDNARASDGQVLIGYRRGDVEFRPFEDWKITIPGRFVEDWEDDNSTFLSYDDSWRNLRISSYTRASRSKSLDDYINPREDVIETLTHNLNGTKSKAFLVKELDPKGDDHYWIIYGYTAYGLRVAKFTISFKDMNTQKEWAINTWQSLQPVSAPKRSMLNWKSPARIPIVSAVAMLVLIALCATLFFNRLSTAASNATTMNRKPTQYMTDYLDGKAHPKAKAFLDDPFFWDMGYEYAPNGNDNGADTLTNYMDWRPLNRLTPSRFYFVGLMAGWGVNEFSPDPISQLIVKESSIGLAFAQLKIDGGCPIWIRDKALSFVNADIVKAMHYPKANIEYLRCLNLMKHKLETAPIISE